MDNVCWTCDGVTFRDLSQWIEHVVSDQHQTKLKMKMVHWSKEEIERTLVLGYIQSKLNVRQILAIILNYGQVSDLYCHPQLRYCIVKMAKRDVAEKTLAQLQAKGHYVRRRSSFSNEEWDILSLELPRLNLDDPFYRQHVNIFNLITNPSLDEQIRGFFQRVTMKQKELNMRQQMLDELEKVLTFGKVHPFGSFLTGLGDPNSDVDAYFEDGGEEKRDKKKILKAVSNTINKARIKKAKFGRIIKYLPHIRIPIITFMHNATRVQCDISFENTMAVQNSHLIKFYLSFHPVVRPLMILIRYWSRFHDLTHYYGFKNYSLNLLVLVSLMRMKILPTVELLQFLTAPIIIHDAWNSAFCDDKEEVVLHMDNDVETPIYERPSDVLPFALNFFDMIANLALSDVICTFTGEFINKALFEPGKEHLLPSCQGRYISWTKGQTLNSRISLKSILIVQDPFLLRHNTTTNTNQSTVHKLIQASQQTACRIRSNIQNKYFVNFFFPIQDEQEKKKSATTDPVNAYNVRQVEAYLTAKNAVEPPRSSTIVLTIDDEFETLFISNVKGLDALESILYSMYTLWFNAVRGFSDSVFKKVFDFEVKSRMNGNSDRMAIILEEGHAVGKKCPTFINHNSLQISRKSKKKKKAAMKKLLATNNSNHDIPNISSVTGVTPQADLEKLAVTASTIGVSVSKKRTSNEAFKLEEEEQLSSRKMMKSPVNVDFTNDPQIRSDVGFCAPKVTSGCELEDMKVESTTNSDLNKVDNTVIENSSTSSEMQQGSESFETMFLNESTNLVESQEEEVLSYNNRGSGEMSIVMLKQLKCIDLRIVAKYDTPEKNPHQSKYRVLSSQSRQRHLQTAIYECHGRIFTQETHLYKFWTGREKIAVDVKTETKELLSNTIMNPLDIEKEICRRVLEQYGDANAIPSWSYNFACVAKEFIDRDLVKPQIRITFTELQGSPTQPENEKLPFTEYIHIMEDIFKKSFAEFVHFKLKSWLGFYVEKSNPFQTC